MKEANLLLLTFVLTYETLLKFYTPFFAILIIRVRVGMNRDFIFVILRSTLTDDDDQ